MSSQGTSSSPWIVQRLLARANLIAPRQRGIYYSFLGRDKGQPQEIFATVNELQSLVEIIDRILAVEAIDEGLRDRLLRTREWEVAT